ncbi:hypothetical protein ACFL05_00660 [Patescibacteria group bacterium]
MWWLITSLPIASFFIAAKVECQEKFDRIDSLRFYLVLLSTMFLWFIMILTQKHGYKYLFDESKLAVPCIQNGKLPIKIIK